MVLSRSFDCSSGTRSRSGRCNQVRCESDTRASKLRAIIGTTVSGIFLFLIGLVNAIIVMGIYQTFKTMKEGKLDESELEVLLQNRGFMNRYFGGLFKIVRKPWQIYPVGVLFGLGFDTASEIALFAITVVFAVSSSIPLWMILLLPFLFTCGWFLLIRLMGLRCVLRMAGPF